MKRHPERQPAGQQHELEDREFVDRLAASYAPTPLTPARRVAFDAALRGRIHRPRPWRLLALPLATASLAAVVWFGFSGERGRDAAGTSAWDSELFLSSDISALGDRDDSDVLPDDYLVIAGIFMDE